MRIQDFGVNSFNGARVFACISRDDRTKAFFYVALVFLGILIEILASSVNTSALTYQNDVQIEFTFKPTVFINLSSSNLTISDLSPGSSTDSNIITVRAGTNETNGYTIYSTVGDSTRNYTDLRFNNGDSNYAFTSLSSNKTSLAAFSDNTWGYSYCNTSNDCSSTAYWVSGDTGSTNEGYNGLPIYNASDNTAGVILADSDNANESEIKFKIGAKASFSQPAGTYTNTINFVSIAKIVTTDYIVNFNDGSGAAINIPTSQSGTTTNSAVRIGSDVPMRDGYLFSGWCDVATSDDTCSGTITMPDHIYILNTLDPSVTINMYAMWKSAKLNPNLTVSVDDEIESGREVVIGVSTNPSATGQIIVSVSGTDYFSTLVNGYTELRIANLPAGRYSARVQYLGDDHYGSAEETVRFTIIKGDPLIE